MKESGSGELIVLYESETNLRQIVGRLLRNAGYRVIERTGEAGEALLADDELHDAHMLMLDEMLDDASGYVVALELRERRPDLPVLFMAGYVPSPLLIDALKTPPTEFLVKPFDGSMLRTCVRGLLDRAALEQAHARGNLATT